MSNLIVPGEHKGERNGHGQVSALTEAPPVSGIEAGGGEFRFAHEGRKAQVSKKIQIPRELLVLLSDFMETRKMAGHLAIEFRNGCVASVEAVTKKSYK